MSHLVVTRFQLWGDVVTQYLHRVGPGRREYLCAVVIIIGGSNGDIELAREGMFECEAGEGLRGVGYESTDGLCDDFSRGIWMVMDVGWGALGPEDGIEVGMLLILNFRCTNGPLKSLQTPQVRLAQ